MKAYPKTKPTYFHYSTGSVGVSLAIKALKSKLLSPGRIVSNVLAIKLTSRYLCSEICTRLCVRCPKKKITRQEIRFTIKGSRVESATAIESSTIVLQSPKIRPGADSIAMWTQSSAPERKLTVGCPSVAPNRLCTAATQLGSGSGSLSKSGLK